MTYACCGFYLAILRVDKGIEMPELEPVVLARSSASTLSGAVILAVFFLVLICLRELNCLVTRAAASVAPLPLGSHRCEFMRGSVQRWSLPHTEPRSTLQVAEMSPPQRLHPTDYLVAAVTLLRTGRCLARSLRPWSGSVALEQVGVRLSWPTSAVDVSPCDPRSVVVVLWRVPKGAATMERSEG